jgi:hypothetical protein
MNEKELSKLYRHNKTEKAYYLDIQLEDYRDAYSNWDYSPYINRDLDDDLLEYLVSCSYEIPKSKSIIINFHLLNQPQDINREKKSQEGMHNFFQYKVRKLKNSRLRLIRNTAAFLIIGTALLITAIITSSSINNSFINKLISEGLFIGAWVMIWEMFSIWFFKVKTLSSTIKHHERLQNSKIIFKYEN